MWKDKKLSQEKLKKHLKKELHEHFIIKMINDSSEIIYARLLFYCLLSFIVASILRSRSVILLQINLIKNEVDKVIIKF